MAGGLCEHRRPHVDLEEMLLLTWRWQGGPTWPNATSLS